MDLSQLLFTVFGAFIILGLSCYLLFKRT
ncbi:hypothetical protein KLEB273_gp260 [Bacillus phage vB_BauM_KLEB27-3]|nr:hypothetical protein KLEB273_gp260 [Bacillus phage vB_BauM_KLEB27-3]